MIGIATVDQVAAAALRGEDVVDVRTADEYAAGHVPGARFVPLMAVPLRLSEFDRHRPVYVVCESGARGFQAGQYLNQHGYRVLNLEGGMAAWRAGGLPVETGHVRVPA
jgi:rhodanese-related sulfurtransferase